MGRRLTGTLVSADQLADTERIAMFELMDRHYANITPDRFHADLRRKRWVILLTDPADGSLCGFSTQTTVTCDLGGRTITALYSGDTIIAPEHWGDIALSHVWGRLAVELIDAHPQGDLYWFLISKGYKTYRFLPVFFRQFHPRFDAATPGDAKHAIDAFARAIHGDAYDPASGIVRASAHSDRLREGLADPTPQRLRDPHVRYFIERNPHYARGDELCCLAPLTRDNFAPAAWRVIDARAAVMDAAR